MGEGFDFGHLHPSDKLNRVLKGPVLPGVRRSKISYRKTIEVIGSVSY